MPKPIGAAKRVSIPVLRKGMQGAYVRWLQILLNMHHAGNTPLKPDGSFGQKTFDAVVSFQKSVALTADGVVGRDTWIKLQTIQAELPQAAVTGGPSKPIPAATVPDPQISPATSVADWSLTRRFTEVLKLTPKHMLPELGAQFKAMLTPLNVSITVAVLVAWAVSHAFGAGEIADILMAIAGFIFLGLGAFRAGRDLGECLAITVDADIYSDLDQASDRLAEAIAIIGVLAFFALIARLAAKFKIGERIDRATGNSKIPDSPPPTQKQPPPPKTPEGNESSDTPKSDPPPQPKKPPATFADNNKLQDHYNRHGGDFGANSPAEYQSQASDFLTGQKEPGVLEKIRPNGDIVRYNPNTDEFGVVTQSGTIRTYYEPDPAVHGYPTNLDYFNAQ